MADITPNPYVGPRPFERQDSARFFGRDQEARELLSLIVANRTVVLYAQSGAGKTSLLNAQVIPLLEAEGFEVWPVARVQGPAVTSMDPAEIQNIYAFYSLFSWAGHEGDTAVWSRQTIPVYLQTVPHTQDESGYDQPRVLIFDQLEELFTAFPARWQERESFLNQIARALDNDPLLRVVFSLREDYVAQLDPYAHLLPRNLGVRFRLERMRPEAALAAIRSPLRETECNFAPGVAEQLVEDLRAVRAETLAGQVKTVTGEFVEPVQLQVVCQNLWEDLPPEVTTITAEHLRQFGDVDQALSNFYTRAVNRALPQAGVDEEELRDWFEKALITPAGTRGTVYRGAEETAGVRNTAVQTLEDMHIIRGEIRAGSRWVELTHDRLIEPIQQANRQWHDARQAARLKRIRQIAIGIVTLVLIIGLGTPFLSLVSPGAEGDLIVRTTATAFAAAVEVAATEVYATGTAQEMMAAESQGTVAALAETSTAQAPANETAAAAIATATADTIVRNTAVAQTAVYQDALNATATMEVILFSTVVAQTAVAQQTQEASLLQAAAEATRTFAELERLRVPVRPLQPGISIGNQNSNTAGTLSAFVVDDEGVFYLLGPSFALGAADSAIWQPSPIDGGQPENAVAFTTRSSLTTGSSTIDAARLIGIARLEPGISFQTTVPGIGPIVGTRPPVLGMIVWVYGRTSGLVERQISCVAPCRATIGGSVTVNADFTLDRPLSSGDEGALVLDGEGYAIGIVAANTADGALGAGMTAVLDEFDAELVAVGQQLANYELRRPIESVAFSPDERWFAVGGEEQIIRIWDLSNPQSEPETLLGHTGSIKSIIFSHDSKLLISGGWDRIINVWDLENLSTNSVMTTTDRTGRIELLAISPDNQWLASGTWNNTIQLWNINDLEADPLILRGHTEPVWSLSFSPDGQTLASGSLDNTIRLWDVPFTTPTQQSDYVPATRQILRGHTGDVLSIAFSADGKWLGSSGNEIIIWNLDSAEFQPEVTRIIRGTELVRSISFSPDSQTLASGNDLGFIGLWSVHSDFADQPNFIDAHLDWILDLSFAPDGVRLASGSADGFVKIWLVR